MDERRKGWRDIVREREKRKKERAKAQDEELNGWSKVDERLR